jgi:hypothetical protein
MVAEQFISFPVAKLLKSIGFTWEYVTYENLQFHPSHPDNGLQVPKFIIKGNAKSEFGFVCFNDEGKIIRPKKYIPKNKHFPRPTQSMAVKWLWENYQIHIISGIDWHTKLWWGHFENHSEQESDQSIFIAGIDFGKGTYDFYEEAIEACLEYASKFVLENKPIIS